MTKHLTLLLFIWLAGCSDSTGSGKESITPVIGFWFACEIGASSDCMILDDDGYQFTADGEVYDIYEVTQGSEPECGGSPCFRADQRSITVYRQLIGTYTYDDNSLEIVLDSDIMPACTENVIWNTYDDFFENQSSCLYFQSTHIRKYTGEVTLIN